MQKNIYSGPPEYNNPFNFLRGQAQIPGQEAIATVKLGVSNRLFERNRQRTLEKLKGNSFDEDLKSEQTQKIKA